jgi:GT2 family glycosyltransferase
MLHTLIPYSSRADAGEAYNTSLARLGADDWACLLDHDAMWTTDAWHGQIEQAIRQHPTAGLFTACTNRIGANWQRAAESNPRNHDMRYHRRIGQARQRRFASQLQDVTTRFPLGGVVMILSRRTWEKVGGFRKGMFCVDHQMHFAVRRAGLGIFLLPGLYVYHWRRAGGEPTKHLPRVTDCECRSIPNR